MIPPRLEIIAKAPGDRPGRRPSRATLIAAAVMSAVDQPLCAF